jgi:hypothetical protein
VTINPTNCMNALRQLAKDALLDQTERLLSAEQAIKSYVSAANPTEPRGWLVALDKEIARQPVDVFWPEVRRMITRLMNQSPNHE